MKIALSLAAGMILGVLATGLPLDVTVTVEHVHRGTVRIDPVKASPFTGPQKPGMPGQQWEITHEPAEAEVPGLWPEVEVYCLHFHQVPDDGWSELTLWQADQDGRTGEWFLRHKQSVWLNGRADTVPEWDGERWMFLDDSRDRVIRAKHALWTYGRFDPVELSDGRGK